MCGNQSVTYLMVSGLIMLVIGVAWPAWSGRFRRPMPIMYSVSVTPAGEFIVQRDTPDGHAPLGMVFCRYRRVSEGLVAERVGGHSWSIEFYWNTTPSSQALIDEARAATVARLVADGYGAAPGFSAQKLAVGDYAVRTPRMRGLAIDGLAYIALLGVGVLWAQGLRWAWRADARHALVQRGEVCVRCGYDTRGLRSTKCPECGERV